MGTIFGTFGSKPKEEYEKWFEQDEEDRNVGDIQIVPVKGKGQAKFWVCNIVCMKKQKSHKPPEIKYGALYSALDKVAEFAKQNNAAVHFSKIHSSTTKLKWSKVVEILNSRLFSSGIDVIIYTRDADDKEKCEKSKKKFIEQKKQPQSAADPLSSSTPAPPPPMQASTSSDSTRTPTNEQKKASAKQQSGKKKVISMDDPDSEEDLPQESKQALSSSQTKTATENSTKKGAVSSFLQVSGSQSITQIQNSAHFAENSDDIFAPFKFYLFGALNNERKLRKFIAAYDGMISNDAYEPDITHVITDGKWNDELEEIASEMDHSVKFVNSQWVFECIEKEARLSEAMFKVSRKMTEES